MANPSAAQQEVLEEDKEGPFTFSFSKLVYESLNLWRVPGISIAVVDGNATWAEGYGLASFPDSLVTPSTLFYAGSTTKAFTAAALSLLVDDDQKYPKVHWDTPISDLLRDDFVLEDEYATAHITIEDALSHRSGLPAHDLSYGAMNATVKSTVRDARYLPMTAEPRTEFQYSNIMYIVASHLIETLTNKWLGDFLRDSIWLPLDMRSTYFSTTAAQDAPEDLAQGYVYYEEEFKPVPCMDLGVVSGAGSVVSNVLDYTKWLKALINMSGPIPKSGYKALRTSRAFVEEEDPSIFTGPQTYSLGWFRGVYQGYEYFTHSGGMEAFGSEVIFFPSLKYGIVLFGNTGVTSNCAELKLMWHLIDEKLGVPDKNRFDWNQKHKKQLDLIAKKHESASRKFYPTSPNPAIPQSLPYQNYTGTYYDPGYHNVMISLSQDNQLYFVRSTETWQVKVTLEHIFGDYFMAYIDSITAPGMTFKKAVPAEFKIGADGIVKSFGILLEETMGLEKTWFNRI